MGGGRAGCFDHVLGREGHDHDRPWHSMPWFILGGNFPLLLFLLGWVGREEVGLTFIMIPFALLGSSFFGLSRAACSAGYWIPKTQDNNSLMTLSTLLFFP